MPIHLFTDYLSLLVGFQLYLNFNKNTLPIQYRFTYIIGALLGALIGARVLALLANPALFLEHLSLVIIFSNKTIIGAIVGGIIGIEIAKKISGITRRTGDGIVIPLAIAIIIGRIGCEFAGVTDGTIGAPCTWAWCFRQGDNFPRHPLPLYEIIYLLLLLPFFFTVWRKGYFAEGSLFRIFIILYLGLRFFLEFLKDSFTLYGLSPIQYVCLAVCLWYLYTLTQTPLLKRNVGKPL